MFEGHSFSGAANAATFLTLRWLLKKRPDFAGLAREIEAATGERPRLSHGKTCGGVKVALDFGRWRLGFWRSPGGGVELTAFDGSTETVHGF